ncbi:uncharacterized protein LOC106169001 [Lingula anatina]|uniref:Uncharacterized protein LOC106169001 n=1 Tax=Lingula anatina TaxID=7574 RepID=A0A1S3J0F2_LINAN|nr:uncharacterized protein LOC106169001 [Lingula anatina]|eukprot:XP_013403738.1 uncharacterized protein LOC106169001 [Lingula anatina]
MDLTWHLIALSLVFCVGNVDIGCYRSDVGLFCNGQQQAEWWCRTVMTMLQGTSSSHFKRYWPYCWCPQTSSTMSPAVSSTASPKKRPTDDPPVARPGVCNQEGTYCRPIYNVSDIYNTIPGIFVTRETLAESDIAKYGTKLPILSMSRESLGLTTGYIKVVPIRKRKRRAGGGGLVSDRNRCCEGFSFYHCPGDDDTVTEVVGGQDIVWRPMQSKPDCTGEYIQVVQVKACSPSSCNQGTTSPGNCEAEFHNHAVLMTCNPKCPQNVPELKFQFLSYPSACLCLNT